MVADKVLGAHNAPVALARTTTAIVHLKVSAASPNKDLRLWPRTYVAHLRSPETFCWHTFSSWHPNLCLKYTNITGAFFEVQYSRF